MSEWLPIAAIEIGVYYDMKMTAVGDNDIVGIGQWWFDLHSTGRLELRDFRRATLTPSERLKVDVGRVMKKRVLKGWVARSHKRWPAVGWKEPRMNKKIVVKQFNEFIVKIVSISTSSEVILYWRESRIFLTFIWKPLLIVVLLFRRMVYFNRF